MDRGRANFGVWLILIGLIFLGFNMGWLDHSFWVILEAYWPLLLILLGIQIAMGRSRLWLVPPIIAAVLFAALFTYGPALSGIGWRPTDSLNFRYNLDPQAISADLFIDVGAVDLVIKRGEPSTIGGTLRYSGPAPMHSGELRGDRYHFNLHHQPVLANRGRANEWQIDTPPGLPTDLEVKMGAGRVRLDLRGVDIERLRLSGGAGQFEAEFDSAGGHTDVEISTGASEVRIVAPGYIGVRVRFTGGLTTNNLSEAGLQLHDGWYVSPNYSTANRTIDVVVSSGVGRLELVRGPQI